jgi:hypothetical protein
MLQARELLGCSSQRQCYRRTVLQVPYPPVELALGAEVREVGAQVRPSDTPEVALAAKARPLGEDGKGDDLRVGKQADRLSVAPGSG